MSDINSNGVKQFWRAGVLPFLFSPITPILHCSISHEVFVLCCLANRPRPPPHARNRIGLIEDEHEEELKSAAAAGNAPMVAVRKHPASETGVQTSTLSGKLVARAGSSPASAVCKTAALILS